MQNNLGGVTQIVKMLLIWKLPVWLLYDILFWMNFSVTPLAALLLNHSLKC